ncbi:head-tail connector protein [Gordonia phage Lamberg]|uniref:Head-to-tail stopper n=1 Tax=Gordonia phage Lamberg TaxID=2790987 RepID=A0A7T3KBT3_9CAUD|nr:head-tail connector protein [Gordonia phage Lamberg]QPX62244.1 head-to-tail stopper [Gordonia phage Lamberg]UXE04675.1 head-to-tail stopper [Gordonia phage Nettuno]
MIDQFFTWPVVVERRRGSNTRGPVFDAPTTVMCRVRMESRIATTESGDEVVTVATASCAASTAHIPIGSRVTLPDQLSGRRGEVAVAGLHDAGIPAVAHYQFQITGGA